MNQQFGAGTLRCAAEGLQQPWQTRAQRRSPLLHHSLGGTAQHSVTSPILSVPLII
ncbi:MAG: DUF4113 domain-containing protein [Leptolyngbya sp. SIOISBB]|nr:DUF4113 domain-containing protein [Leptolyngbya sp. SIOISBB]